MLAGGRSRPKSGLELDLVDVECDEDRVRERSAAGSSWAHTSACGKDESTEVSVGGARPTADRLGNVVMPADAASRIHVEGLSLGVGVDIRGESDLEPSPLLT